MSGFEKTYYPVEISKIETTCDTCDYPIHKGEEIYKSRIVTYSIGTAYYYYKYGGTRHRKDWVQCAWCIKEWNKESEKEKRIYNWKKKDWDWQYKKQNICKWFLIIMSTIIITYLWSTWKDYQDRIYNPLTMVFISSLVFWHLLWHLLLIPLFGSRHPKIKSIDRYKKRIRIIENKKNSILDSV